MAQNRTINEQQHPASEKSGFVSVRGQSHSGSISKESEDYQSVSSNDASSVMRRWDIETPIEPPLCESFSVTDMCTICAAKGMVKKATHICRDCSRYGRYYCQRCWDYHNKFLPTHDTLSLSVSSDRLMEELTIPENVREHLAEMNAKFKDEENAKEEAWVLLKQEQASNETLKVELEDLRAKYEEVNRLKDEALKRLSAIASRKLRDSFANIADLSDQNRPTKVAENFTELYNNEWSSAFEVLQEVLGEKEAIDFLLNSLMESFKICQELSSENYLEKVQHCIEFPVQRVPSVNTQCELPDKLIQQIKEFRKSRATYVINYVIKEVLDKVQSKYDNKKEVQAYKRKCAELCWLMVVQNPPLILSTTAQQKFDTNLYKGYTKLGKYVDYVVWPALLLREGGPLLSKGLAQGCKRQS